MHTGIIINIIIGSKYTFCTQEMNNADEIERNQNDGNTNEAHKETIDTVNPVFD